MESAHRLPMYGNQSRQRGKLRKMLWKMMVWRMRPSTHLGETKQKSCKKKTTDKQTDFMVNPGHKKYKKGNSEKSKSVDQKTKKLER
jgi:hypothetical protein